MKTIASPPVRVSRAVLDPALQPLARLALTVADGVLARVWLEGPGDSCATCAMASTCAERRRCLHLVAGAGLTARLDGPYRRYPIGAGEVGRVPVTGRPFTAGPELPSLGLADPAWLANHGVRAFLAVPLPHAGRTIGVLAVFSTAPPDPGRTAALERVAELGAIALGHLHAFRELALERNRIAARAATRARAAAEPAEAGRAGPETAGAPGTLRALADTERDAIARALAHTGGRVSGPRGAARILGLKPTTLFSRMKKLGVARRPR